MIKIDNRQFFVYVLRCADDTLYTGYSNDVDKRVARHNSGKGAKYTRSRLPVVLIYYREFGSYLTAVREEARIKKLRKVDKEALVNGGYDSDRVTEI